MNRVHLRIFRINLLVLAWCLLRPEAFLAVLMGASLKY